MTLKCEQFELKEAYKKAGIIQLKIHNGELPVLFQKVTQTAK